VILRDSRLWRVLFWCALLFACTMAVVPVPPHLPIDSLGDKFEHSLAFAVLALLGAVAYRATPLPRLLERLSFLGAAIELFQSIPSLHRDCDIRDWVTDTIAAGVVLGLVWVWRRTRHSSPA
jgi:VanZ family protein